MSNPMLNEDKFSSQERVLDCEPRSIQGTVSKVLMLFVCLLAGAAISLYLLFNGMASVVPTAITASAISDLFWF